jgi:hypothetical protein
MSAISINQAAKILNLSIATLHRRSKQEKYGIKKIARPGHCMDDRLSFFDGDSVAAAAALIQATKELRGAAQLPTPAIL